VLPQLLDAVTPAQHAALQARPPPPPLPAPSGTAQPRPTAATASLQRAVACVWPRLFWLHRFSAAADAQLEPRAPHCDGACAPPFAALAEHDAFGTLMWLLRTRLPPERRRAEAAALGLDGAPAWATPARSCRRALELAQRAGMRLGAPATATAQGLVFDEPRGTWPGGGTNKL